MKYLFWIIVFITASCTPEYGEIISKTYNKEDCLYKWEFKDSIYFFNESCNKYQTGDSFKEEIEHIKTVKVLYSYNNVYVDSSCFRAMLRTRRYKQYMSLNPRLGFSISSYTEPSNCTNFDTVIVILKDTL